ncbi:MAG: hypothetical protein JWM20_332 [Patescibacteria group bacterium]|nr:hypothetical protein [Patescibacteria group bacterium]
MKKVIIGTVLLVITVVCLGIFFYNKGISDGNKEISSLLESPKATVTEEVLTADSASEFPGSIVMWSDEPGVNSFFLFNSLPLMQKALCKEVTPEGVLHTNITFIRSGDRLLGFTPEGRLLDTTMSSVIRSAINSNVSAKDGIVFASFHTLRNQRALLLDFLPNASPAKLEGVPCSLKALNVYGNDPGIKTLCFKGTVHHVSASFLDELALRAKGTLNKSEGGAYVMRVDDSMLPKLGGTKGGSVTVRFGNEERFFGIADGYFQMAKKDNQTGVLTKGTFILLRPITMKDIDV